MNIHLDICLTRGEGEDGSEDGSEDEDGGEGEGGDDLQTCPVCSTLLPPEAINTHLDTCLTNTSTSTDTNTNANTNTNTITEAGNKKRPLENDNLTSERKKRRVGAPPPLPECPVCFEAMAPPVQIHQCGMGHLVCGGCRPRVQECPSRCGHPMVARAIGMEQYVRELHEQMGNAGGGETKARVTCTVCDKELSAQYIKKHMANVHKQ